MFRGEVVDVCNLFLKRFGYIQERETARKRDMC